jgi:MFS family permease
VVSKNNAKAASPQSKFYYGYAIVTAAALIMIACMGSYYTFGVFLKPIVEDLGGSRALISGAFSLAVVIMGLCGIFWGKLNDRYGPRWVLTISGILVSSGYLFSFLENSIWQLYLFYGFLAGVGLGGIFVPLTTTVPRWFIVRRGIMTGIVVSGIGFGNLLSGPIANTLLVRYSWRTSYLIIGLVTLGVTVIAAQFLKRDPAQVGQEPYGAKSLEKLKVRNSRADFSLKSAVRTIQFWYTIALNLCFGFCLTGIMVHIAPYATDIGNSPSTAASYLSVIGVGSIIGRLVFGRIGDRIGYRMVYILCFALMCFSLIWILFIISVGGFYVFALAFGLAYGGCATGQPLLAANLFGLKSHGVILGVIGNGFSLGCAIGPLVLGYIFDVSRHYLVGLIASAVIAAVGLVFTALVKPTGQYTSKT